LPRDLFRIDDEIEVISRIAGITAAGGALTIEGFACLSRLGAVSEGAQSVRVRAVDDTARTVDLAVRPVARPDLAAAEPAVAAVTGWAGYVATVDPAALTGDEPAGDADEPADWRVVVEVGSRGVHRTTEQHAAARLCALRGATVPIAGDRRVRAELAGDQALLHVEPTGPVITAARLESDGSLAVEGHGAGGSATTGWLRLSGAAEKRSRWPVEVGADRAFRARLPLAELASDLQLPTAPQTLRRQALEQWDLSLRVGKTSARPLLSPELVGARWSVGPREWMFGSNRPGVAVLVEREPRPVFHDVTIAPDGTVTFRAEPGGTVANGDLVLDDGHGRTHAVEASVDPATGSAVVTVPPPPPDGTAWDLVVRRPDAGDRAATGTVPCAVTERLLGSLPASAAVDGGHVVVGLRGRDGPVVYRSTRSLPSRP
jgi:hypothetical protein